MHKKMRALLQKRKERMDNIQIDTLDTPEALCPMADEIVPLLATILRDVAELIELMTKKSHKLDESKPGGRYSRACLKNAFCQMCVTICGRFVPNEGRIGGKGIKGNALCNLNLA